MYPTRWEYDTQFYEDGVGITQDKMLAHNGKLGWELVACYPAAITSADRETYPSYGPFKRTGKAYIFKRPLP